VREILAATTAMLLAGCQLPEGLPSAKEAAPKVTFDKLRIDAITFDKVDTTFVLDVANPYPVQIPVKAFTWDLDLAGSSFADGKSSEGLTIGARKTSKVRIPVSAAFRDVIAVGKATKGQDSVPFHIAGDLSFDTPIGPLTLPYDAKGDFPALRAPKFSPKALRVEKLDLAKQTARLAVDFDVSSENGSSLSFPKFAYGLKLGGKQVASGNASVPAVTDAATFTLPVDVNLVQLGTTVANAISKKTDLEVGLTADADVQTPFGLVPLAVSEARTVPVR
jgi:LEA14-like dessication related protein